MDASRCRVWFVPTDFILGVISRVPLKLGETIRICEIEGMPEDAKIVDCFMGWYTFLRNCIVFKVWSATFDPVPSGQQMPELTITIREREVKLAEEKPKGREFI